MSDRYSTFDAKGHKVLVSIPADDTYCDELCRLARALADMDSLSTHQRYDSIIALADLVSDPGEAGELAAIAEPFAP